MKQQYFEPTNSFYCRMKSLFEQARYDEMLNICGNINEVSPFATIARAWEIAASGRAGETQRLADLVRYDRDVLVFETNRGSLSSCAPNLRREIYSAQNTLERIEPTSNMPYEKGSKTQNILEGEGRDYTVTHRVFSTCFAAYVKYTGRAAAFKQVSSRSYLIAWINFVETGGSLGAHFHRSCLFCEIGAA